MQPLVVPVPFNREFPTPRAEELVLQSWREATVRTVMAQADDHIEGQGLPRAQTLQAVAAAYRATLTAIVLSGEITVDVGAEMTRLVDMVLQEKLGS